MKISIKIIAVDESTSGWFAFQPPRELARLSWAVDQVVSFGVPLFSMGLALYAAGLLYALRGRKRAGPDSSIPADTSGPTNHPNP